MNDRILLILGLYGEEDDGIAIQQTSHGRDVTMKGDVKGREDKAVDEAFRYAVYNSKKVVALQFLNSDLYHYGYNDIILSARAKTHFLTYVRGDVLKRGLERERKIREQASDLGIPFEFRNVETDDPISVVLEEAGKGYEVIFLPEEKKRLFPLNRKTMREHLRKKGYDQIVTC